MLREREGSEIFPNLDRVSLQGPSQNCLGLAYSDICCPCILPAMAFTMKIVAPSTSYISARPVVSASRSSRSAGGRARLVIEAKTVWQLAPQPAGKSEDINLTDAINTQKSFTSVGDKKHQDAEQVGWPRTCTKGYGWGLMLQRQRLGGRLLGRIR
jgi:hypothetical protein